MEKIGRGANIGTAEGALMGRAAHALHAPDPVLDDFWAVELLTAEAQASVRDPEHYRTHHAAAASPMACVSVAGLSCLRCAEDEVMGLVAKGVQQYVVLGAGFDTFALRNGDAAPGLTVFEVDHPDVQQLKRARIEAARVTPASLPEFVPVDFEGMSLAQGLAGSSFDPSQPSVFSWMNTIPYLTEAAIASTLDDLASLAARGSRLILNYVAPRASTALQAASVKDMSRYAADVGETHRKFWEAAELEALLASKGFRTLAHITDEDLYELYFREREDGLRPGIPIRVLIAERSDPNSIR